MKKTIAAISALTLLAAMALPMSVSAEENTTVQPKGYAGSDTFNVDPTPNPVDATVQLGIDPAYTVTIPAEFKLNALQMDGTYRGTGTLTAEGVFLNEGKVINVTLKSASGFKMVTPEAANYKLPYTANTEAFGDVAKTGGQVARFITPPTQEAKAQPQNVTLNLRTDEAPTYAGKYTDPVVFHISVADAPTT